MLTKSKSAISQIVRNACVAVEYFRFQNPEHVFV